MVQLEKVRTLDVGNQSGRLPMAPNLERGGVLPTGLNTEHLELAAGNVPVLPGRRSLAAACPHCDCPSARRLRRRLDVVAVQPVSHRDKCRNQIVRAPDHLGRGTILVRHPA